MRRTVLRGLLALLAAIVSAVFLVATTARPRLVPVVSVTATVPEGSVVSPTDLGTLYVTDPPPTAIRTPASAIGLYAETTLEPGQILVQSDLGRSFGPGKGKVEVTIPVTPAESDLASVGDVVDLVGYLPPTTPNSRSAVLPLAQGVKVIGVFTSSGAPVTSSGTANGSVAPALVQVAVSPQQAAAIIPFVSQSGASVWLVEDPYQNGVAVVPIPSSPRPSHR